MKKSHDRKRDSNLGLLKSVNVENSLKFICQKAVANDPQARYQTADDLSNDLSRFLANDIPVGWKEPAWDKLKRVTRRHPRVVFSLGSALVVGVVLSVIFNLQQRKTNDRLAETNDQLIDSQNEEAELRNSMDRQTITNLVHNGVWDEVRILLDDFERRNGPLEPSLRYYRARALLGLYENKKAKEVLESIDLESIEDRNLKAKIHLALAESGYFGLSDSAKVTENLELAKAHGLYESDRFLADGLLEKNPRKAVRETKGIHPLEPGQDTCLRLDVRIDVYLGVASGGL